VKIFVKNAVAGLCITALFLLVVSAPARAQVLAHSGEVSGYGGYSHVNLEGAAIGNNHPFFGGSYGYNVTPAITVLGEYTYMPLGSEGGVSAKTQFFDGGVRFNFLPATRFVPYAVVAFGGDHYSIGGGGSSASFNGYYFGGGGGVSCYLGKNWGVRPEFRYVRQDYSGSGFNSFQESGAFFYQWGGTGTKKK
jgi:hypothetical protein